MGGWIHTIQWKGNERKTQFITHVPCLNHANGMTLQTIQTNEWKIEGITWIVWISHSHGTTKTNMVSIKWN